MSDPVSDERTGARTVREQLEGAVRDLWSLLEESGEEYVVFLDRRRLHTRVERVPRGVYRVSWEQEDGSWISYDGEFQNPREAAFHGFQGPH